MGAAASLIATLANLGVGEANKRMLATTKDTPQSAYRHADALGAAAEKRSASIAPDAPPLVMGLTYQEPDEKDLGRMARHMKGKTADGTPVSRIDINPYADSAYLAHEMGHALSQKTKAGLAINKARHAMNSNPMLGKSLVSAMAFSVPAIASALQAGDDDTAESLALATAIASPKLIDEALATKNALAIMNDAGLRANLGQRGRLAGGYLSYLAPVIMYGGLGNFAGNLVDEHTALYDL